MAKISTFALFGNSHEYIVEPSFAAALVEYAVELADLLWNISLAI